MIICLGKIPSNYILGPGGHKGVSLKVQATGSALSSSARAHSQSPALPEGYNNGLREPLTHKGGLRHENPKSLQMFLYVIGTYVNTI